MNSNPLTSIRMAPRLRSAYDVFPGDADGICALHQLRLAYPREALLVTGVKRDAGLLQRLRGRGGVDVCAVGVSLNANAEAVQGILDAGGQVTCYDHRTLPQALEQPRLQLHGGDAAAICTSVLVDRHLQGRFRAWAVAAVFGANRPALARRLAFESGLDCGQMLALQELGLMLEHNAYGDLVEDLHIAPDTLYRALHQYAGPFDFIEASPHYQALAKAYRDDLARLAALSPCWQAACGAVYVLPAAAWSRRLADVFARRLVSPASTRSFAVLARKNDGSYAASVCSGRPILRSANRLCERFRTGGGSKSLARIGNLPAGELESFIGAFDEYFTVGNVVAKIARAA